jgi:hypothetical protein
MDGKQLAAIHTLIKSKKVSRAMVMERLGTIAIEDIGLHAKSEGKLPTSQELITQYKELEHFEAILNVTDISVDQLQKFIGVLLKDSEVDDFKVAELK